MILKAVIRHGSGCSITLAMHLNVLNLESMALQVWSSMVMASHHYSKEGLPAHQDTHQHHPPADNQFSGGCALPLVHTNPTGSWRSQLALAFIREDGLARKMRFSKNILSSGA